MLQGGTGHKHTVIAPQMPTGGSGRQPIFDHQTHRHVDHPMGVMTAGWGDIGQIDGAMLTAWCTGVRRGGHQEVNRATGVDIAKVVQGALAGGVARGALGASWTGGGLVVTVVRHTFGPRQVLDIDNALRGVWPVFTWSKHRWLS